ncbi:unnamed protein product [Urochloa decumbens]|uniref:Bifunctional inhibitor/plant lipid transfer protein/seed storage helical domain-containing protein n=1 Tax=Urochloa decumbens TaxID=240449 RepID=A0ABC9B679_9POAL
MLPGKAAILLALLFAVVCLNHSVYGNKICNKEDKNRVLQNCNLNIKNGKYSPPALKGSACCQVVRELQGRDRKMMDCIVGLLTNEEKKVHSAVKMMELVGKCVVASRPSPKS